MLIPEQGAYCSRALSAASWAVCSLSGLTGRFKAFLSGQRGDVSTEEAAPVANAEGTHEA